MHPHKEFHFLNKEKIGQSQTNLRRIIDWSIILNDWSIFLRPATTPM